MMLGPFLEIASIIYLRNLKKLHLNPLIVNSLNIYIILANKCDTVKLSLSQYFRSSINYFINTFFHAIPEFPIILK
jgi:hypothetical protein